MSVLLVLPPVTCIFTSSPVMETAKFIQSAITDESSSWFPVNHGMTLKRHAARTQAHSSTTVCPDFL